MAVPGACGQEAVLQVDQPRRRLRSRRGDVPVGGDVVSVAAVDLQRRLPDGDRTARRHHGRAPDQSGHEPVDVEDDCADQAEQCLLSWCHCGGRQRVRRRRRRERHRGCRDVGGVVFDDDHHRFHGGGNGFSARLGRLFLDSLLRLGLGLCGGRLVQGVRGLAFAVAGRWVSAVSDSVVVSSATGSWLLVSSPVSVDGLSVSSSGVSSSVASSPVSVGGLSVPGSVSASSSSPGSGSLADGWSSPGVSLSESSLLPVEFDDSDEVVPLASEPGGLSASPRPRRRPSLPPRLRSPFPRPTTARTGQTCRLLSPTAETVTRVVSPRGRIPQLTLADSSAIDLGI